MRRWGRLLKLHPEGTARFWGALARHDTKMDRLAEGDPILFTGLNRVQAIGRVGCLLRNAALADALWEPDPDTGSWSNVYSVLDFHLVHDLEYSDIQVLAGYSSGDRFQETRVLPDLEQAAALSSPASALTWMRLPLALSSNELTKPSPRPWLLNSAVVDAESIYVQSSQYERAPGTVTLRRLEARLVARYRETLPEAQAKRLRLSVGWTDLYRVEDADLIEAKRSPGHHFVREALGQLLDYAAHSTQPVTRLTVLFPAAPSTSDVKLLHVYGIDCLYWAGAYDFERLEAPTEARSRIARAWSSLAHP